jgi:hypothetical protein
MKVKSLLVTTNWIKPHKDFVRVYVYASFAEYTLIGTTGGVIHDNKGHFIIACNNKLDHAFDVLSAESHEMK